MAAVIEMAEATQKKPSVKKAPAKQTPAKRKATKREDDGGKQRRSNRTPLPHVNPIIVRKPQVQTMLSIGATTLDEMVKDGRIPQPFRINGENGRAVAWFYETIVETAQKWAEEAQATPAE